MRLTSKNSLIFFIVTSSAIIISYAIISVLFRYEDSVSFTVWGVEFWDVVFSGNAGNYYSYCVQNIRGAIHGAPQGSWLTFLPTIIWCFPLWLVKRNPASDVTGMSCILWYKLLLVISTVILCYYIFKIVFLLKNDRKAAIISALFTAGSLEIIDCVCYAGQDEVVYLALYIIGLYHLLKGNRRKSLIFSTIAITLCPLMFVPFICQIMTKEKRLLRIFVNTAITVAPTAIFSIIYSNNATFQSLSEFNSLGLFQTMMNTGTITTSLGPTSISFCMIVIIAVFSYLSKSEDSRIPILASSCALFALTILNGTSFYRLCIYVPFFSILIGISEYNTNMKSFLFVIIGASRFIYSAITSGYNFSGEYLSHIAQRLFGEKALMITETNQFFVIQESTSDVLAYSTRTIAIAGAIAFILLCIKEKEYTELPISSQVSLVIQSSFALAISIALLITLAI